MELKGDFRCLRCGTLSPATNIVDSRGCLACFEIAPANFTYVAKPTGAFGQIGKVPAGSLASTLWHYDNHLPVERKDAVSLGEGFTPLLHAPVLGARLGVADLLVKDEGRNPSWSHKDRFSTVAVSAARLSGANVIATASSGNAGASLAAYAKRAGMNCVVAAFGSDQSPMLIQIRKYGAIVLPFVDKATRWTFLEQAARSRGWIVTSPFHSPVVGSHPIGIEGYKTLAFEIVDQMDGRTPDWCVLPVCYGDAMIGLWNGFKQLRQDGRIDRLPRLVAAEVHGSLTAALCRVTDRVDAMPARFEPLAISIGTAQSTFQALSSLRESNGVAVAVDNAALVATQELLARSEGIFAELAAVTPFEAVRILREKDIVKAGDTVVCVVTASGLKDVDRSQGIGRSMTPISSIDEAWRGLHGTLP